MSGQAQHGLPIDHSPQKSEERQSIPIGEPLYRSPSEVPWSIFSKKETVLIVILGRLAAFLSPLTANIESVFQIVWYLLLYSFLSHNLLKFKFELLVALPSTKISLGLILLFTIATPQSTTFPTT
jgi:hypothetical protein